METFLKNLRSFFMHAHAFPIKWQLELRKAEEFVSALANQAEQLRYVKMVPEHDKDIELLQLRDLRFLLLAKITASAEEELENVLKIVNMCAEMVLEVKGRLSNLEQSLTAVEWGEEHDIALKGSTSMPPVVQLLEWAEDFWRFFHAQHLQISCALAALQLEEESSVEALQAAIKPNCDLPPSLQWSLALSLPLLTATEPPAPAAPTPSASARERL